MEEIKKGNRGTNDLVSQDKSVRRRILGWVNQKVKERNERKIERTFKREEEEGDGYYFGPLRGFISRAQREQEKRSGLLKAEATRQKLESHWLEWENKKKERKAQRKAQEKEARSQAQLAYILRQNEKADRNMDLFNGVRMYTTHNKLIKNQMIGWDRSKLGQL